MVEWIALAVALASLLAVVALTARLSEQAQRLRLLESQLAQIGQAERDIPVLPRTSPLEGVRISVSIEQDHKLPLVANAIRERLEAEDAFIQATDDGCEVVVRGSVRCNNYSDVYYDADLTLTFANGEELTIVESPPNGARQVNLAARVVDRLRRTVESSRLKEERQRALGELNGF